MNHFHWCVYRVRFWSNEISLWAGLSEAVLFGLVFIVVLSVFRLRVQQHIIYMDADLNPATQRFTQLDLDTVKPYPWESRFNSGHSSLVWNCEDSFQSPRLIFRLHKLPEKMKFKIPDVLKMLFFTFVILNSARGWRKKRCFNCCFSACLCVFLSFCLFIS